MTTQPKRTVAFALCGSFCSFSAVCSANTRRDELCASGVSSSPVVSSTVHSTKSGVW